MANVADAATEIVADMAEEVAEQATYVAETSRGLSGRDVGLVLGGIFVGAGLGGALSFVLTRRKLETKYMEIAEDEIDVMREHFRQRLVARDEKPALSELAKEHEKLVTDAGYSGDGPPMAVQPPEKVVEDEDDERPVFDEDAEAQAEARAQQELQELRERSMVKDPQLRNLFEDNPPPDDEWDWVGERQKRSPIRPYVIHIDERQETLYQEVTYTYYEVDDVLCNERDEVIADDGQRQLLVGEDNLDKFGHGSGDSNVVYIRNDRLELDMEICKSPNSFAQEVHGFDPPEIQHGDRRRRRQPFDDE